MTEISVCASIAFPNLKQGPEKCGEFAKLQDYGQAEIERFEEDGVDPLKAYGAVVKTKGDDLKATLTARSRETKQLTREENVSEILMFDILFRMWKPNCRELQWMLPEQLVFWRKILTILKSGK